ncbi:hypothetical protein HYE82_09600 [Streptomyces sp. BR123]|uniref:hypothetical protein n=1 Tax=Streptomyces sp. BR123 TaxID=2749828 RepID=UPI0015C43CE9|nr:hypothetical protein [Streptomyces sp. BR123]NXY94643.1 hypothetical protein [Streptomyces sp. BR123]
MTHGRGALTALHLLLVWAAMALVMPALGSGLLVAAWVAGAGAAVPVFALGALLSVGLLVAAGVPVRTVVPMCGSMPRRLGWAALVFGLGTLGILAGLAAYGADVDLGSARIRIALAGVPYAVAAAFFVPIRWVRLGAVAALAAAVAYGGFVGPDQAQQRRHAAEVARYREHPELLYAGAAPSGMEVSRAEVGPAHFIVEYRSVRQDVFAYVGLTVRSPLTPAPRCPEPAEDGVTCTVDERGEKRTVRDLSGGEREVVLVRRHRDAEVEVSGRTLDEGGLRRLLDSLQPLSDEELEKLMREGKINRIP